MGKSSLDVSRALSRRSAGPSTIDRIAASCSQNVTPRLKLSRCLVRHHPRRQPRFARTSRLLLSEPSPTSSYEA
jgi:hypothetical protein